MTHHAHLNPLLLRDLPWCKHTNKCTWKDTVKIQLALPTDSTPLSTKVSIRERESLSKTCSQATRWGQKVAGCNFFGLYIQDILTEGILSLNTFRISWLLCLQLTCSCLMLCRCQHCLERMKRTPSVWAGVLSTLITWCCLPLCYTLGIHTHTQTHTLLSVTILHLPLFTIRCVWVTFESISFLPLFFFSTPPCLFSTLFCFCVFFCLWSGFYHFHLFFILFFSFFLFSCCLFVHCDCACVCLCVL